MNKPSNFVISFSEAKNNHAVRNKNKHILIDIASLGIGIHVPEGFVITSKAFFEFMSENHLLRKIDDLLSTIHYERPDSLMQVAGHIQKLIIATPLSEEFVNQISAAYKKMGGLFTNPEITIEGKTIKSQQELLRNIKKIWAGKFDAKNLLFNHRHNKDNFENGVELYVFKKLKSKKSGKLFTSDLKIESETKLSSSESSQIKEIGKKLKKHFYLPYEVFWIIDKNKVYVVDLKPMTNTQKSYLVLVRHGTSEYNEKGLWAGWDDPNLTQKGEKDAVIAAKTIKDIHFDIGFASPLIRHNLTLSIIKKALNRKDMPTVVSKALLERNYGDFTGMNKWDVKKQLGEEEFLKLRRSWDYPVPNGESLKDVYDRVVPYYKDYILPKLKAGKNIIVSSSGNALRSLVKYLENISDEDISKLEIAPGEVYVYQLDEDGKVVSKEIRNQHENVV